MAILDCDGGAATGVRFATSEADASGTEIIAHGGAVKSVAVTPDGKRAVTAGFDYSIIVWDLAASDQRCDG